MMLLTNVPAYRFDTYTLRRACAVQSEPCKGEGGSGWWSRLRKVALGGGGEGEGVVWPLSMMLLVLLRCFCGAGTEGRMI